MTEERASFHGDEFGWCIQLAERLRQGQGLDEADRADLIEHLDQFAVARRCDVTDASLHLLQRLLEASTEPEVPPAYRKLGVIIMQRKLRKLFQQWPGLLPTAPDLFNVSYAGARTAAAASTGKPEDAFPPECPWTLAEAMALKWPRPTTQ